MWLNNSSLGPAEQFITGQITAAIGIKCGKGCLDGRKCTLIGLLKVFGILPGAASLLLLVCYHEKDTIGPYGPFNSHHLTHLNSLPGTKHENHDA